MDSSVNLDRDNHLCDICGVSYGNNQDLKEHNWSLMHHIKKEHKEGKGIHHTCTLCSQTFKNLTDYGRHLNETTHKNNVEDDRRLSSKSPDSTNDMNRYVSKDRTRRPENRESGNRRRNSRWDSPNYSVQQQPNEYTRWNRDGYSEHCHYPDNTNFWQDNPAPGYGYWQDYGPNSYNYGYPQSGPPMYNETAPLRGERQRDSRSFHTNFENHPGRYESHGQGPSDASWNYEVEPDQYANDRTGDRSAARSKSTKSDTENNPDLEKSKDSLSCKASKLIDDILSGKPVSKCTPDRGLADETPRKPSSGVDILETAENLCLEMKKKRASLQEKKKEREAAKVRLERDKWDREAERLAQTSQSHVSGVLNESRLSTLSSSMEATRTSLLEPQKVEAAPSIITSDRVAPATTSASMPSSSGSASATVLGGSVPKHKPILPSLSKLKSLQKSDNIVKLINSPRSRKERIEVAKFLQSHKKKLQRPKLSNQDKDSADLDVDSLPEDIRLQINQLIDDVMTDCDITSFATEPTECSHVITIAPECSETGLPLEYSLDVNDDTLDARDKRHTSTPTNQRSRALTGSGSLRSSDLAHTGGLWDEARAVTSAELLSPGNSFTSSALDAFSKKIDEEISVIASLQSSASHPDQSVTAYDSVTTDSSIQEIHVVPDDADTPRPATPPMYTVPEPIMIVDSPTIKQERTAFPCTSISNLGSSGSALEDSPSKGTSKRRRVSKTKVTSPSQTPEKQVQVNKRQKVDPLGLIEVLSDGSSDEGECTMDMVYTISLQEEEIRSKITTANDAIDQLETLMKKTQEQLKSRLKTKEDLEKEEKKLRKKRMKLLKGAIEKNTSSNLSTSTITNTSSGTLQGLPEASTSSVHQLKTPVVKLERCDRRIEEPDSTEGIIQTVNAPKEEKEPVELSTGLQYLGTVGSQSLDANLLEQLTENYVIMEEAQFKKCLSDSAMSQESEDDLTPVAGSDAAPSTSHHEFKRPEPIDDRRPLRAKKEKPRPPGISSSMSDLNTIDESVENTNSSSKGGSSSDMKKGYTSEPDSSSKGKKKKKKKDPKPSAPPVNSDSSCSVQETKKGKPTKYQKYKPEVQQMIKDYLHASSSSDVSLAGLEPNSSQHSSVSKKKSRKSKKQRDERLSNSGSQSESTSETPVASGGEELEIAKTSKSPAVKLSKSVTYASKHAGAVKLLVLYDKMVITAGLDMVLLQLRAQCWKKPMKDELKAKSNYRGHDSEILCCCIDDSNPKKPTLYSGNKGNQLLVHDIKTGQRIKLLRYADKVCALAKGIKYIHVGLGNGSVLTLDSKTGNNVDAYKHAIGPINCLAAGKEGARPILCVAGQDCSIAVRDARNSLLLRSLEGHMKPPTCLQIIHNLVYSGGPDGMIQIHNLNTGEMQRTIRIAGTINSICADKSERLFVASSPGVIRTFDTQDYRQQQVYYASAGVTCMAMHINHWLHFGTKDGTIEAIQVGSRHYPCQYGSCRLICGRKEDLQKHCMMDHVSPGCKAADVVCLWKECCVTLSMKDGKSELNAVKHIATHVESLASV